MEEGDYAHINLHSLELVDITMDENNLPVENPILSILDKINLYKTLHMDCNDTERFWTCPVQLTKNANA